jgi:hypothetical protein
MDNQTTAAPSVASYVAKYRPRHLTDDQTGLWLPRLRQLVIAAVPTDEHDAKGMLTAGTRFLIDVCGAELLAVDAVLRADTITRWAHRARTGGMNSQTARLYVSRLERLVRVRAGLPGRTGAAGHHRVTHIPLDATQVTTLVTACRNEPAEVLTACIAALGCGVTGSRLDGARFAGLGSGLVVLVTDDNTDHHVVPSFAADAAAVRNVVISSRHWARVREIAASLGIGLDAPRARQTYWLNAAQVPLPVRDGLRLFALGTDALNATLLCLSGSLGTDEQELLRG